MIVGVRMAHIKSKWTKARLKQLGKTDLHRSCPNVFKLNIIILDSVDDETETFVKKSKSLKCS